MVSSSIAFLYLSLRLYASPRRSITQGSNNSKILSLILGYPLNQYCVNDRKMVKKSIKNPDKEKTGPIEGAGLFFMQLRRALSRSRTCLLSQESQISFP